MKLSIGMIVKNEEKYLEKCLSALDKLRKNVECELIIVDTGSTDSTIEIAKRFTDKVYHFDWCDDFAAARNETLKYASGEWYMFLDADEIFVNTDELERFLNSDERHNWVTASYIVINYDNENMISSLPFDAVRLARRTDDLHFEGALHEHFASELLDSGSNIPNCFRLKSCADHYGYISDSNVSEKKKERNKAIIYKEFDKRKNDPIYFMQLYEIAIGDKDIDRVKEYALKCIELSKDSEIMTSIGYMLYANALYISREFDELLHTVKKYFKKKRTFEHLCDISMYMYRGVAHFNTGKYKKAASDFELYFTLRKNYDSATSPESYIHPIYGLDNSIYTLRILECAVAYEQLENPEGLFSVLNMEEPSFFDNEIFFENGYTKDYIMHAVLLAAQGGDRRIADDIAARGTEREKQLMHDVINEASPSPAPADELAAYAAQVKTAICSMISVGMKAQAAELLEQYKQLCPDDKDIAEIEKNL